MIPRVLIIAGSDSGGGAGIQADIKTVTMLGGHAMTAITAITAQNTLGVQAVMPVPAEMVIAQIESVVSDIGVDAVKIGMIGSAETAHAVADVLERLNAPVVFDPVMVATSGDVLADEDTIAAFHRLMKLAALITPNTPELAVLSGFVMQDDRDRPIAARRMIKDFDCNAVLSKGGHPIWNELTVRLVDGQSEVSYDDAARVYDVLYERGGDHRIWESRRLNSRNTHGTGCTLASGIAVGLGRGLDLHIAIDQAIAFVQAAIIAAPDLGAGHGPMGHALGVIPFDVITGRKCPA